MKKRYFSLLVAGTLTLSTVSMSQADNILLTRFDFTGYDVMEANLEADGHTVTQVDATTGGNVAAALSATSYDQVFLWDLTSTSYLNNNDISALVSFFDSHSSIVLDSRSYGYHFQGSQESEVQLLQNIASEFSTQGGGIWLGTDHDPAWTNNANLFLAAADFDTISGSHSQAVNDWDPNSVLLDGVDPFDLWAEGASVGHVSLGIQQNGLDMRYHFGHSSTQSGAIPYISASFGNYIAPDEDPDDHIDNGPVVDPIPEPATMLLFGTGLLGLIGSRIRRKK